MLQIQPIKYLEQKKISKTMKWQDIEGYNEQENIRITTPKGDELIIGEENGELYILLGTTWNDWKKVKDIEK